MSRLVLKQLNHLESDEKERRPYINQIPFISKLFKEDFQFLAEHKDYFRTHYHLFLSYYYFYILLN